MKLAAIFLVAALLLSFFGAGALGALAWQIGIVLGIIALVLFVMSLIKGRSV